MKSTKRGTVAIIGGKSVSDAELEEACKDKLASIKAQELALKHQILEDFVVRRLLEDAAKARGLAVPALEKAEIDTSPILQRGEDDLGSLAGERGSSYAVRWNVPEHQTEVFKAMTRDQQWEINRKFLGQIVARGDEIILSTLPWNAKPNTFYARELACLFGLGFVPTADGTRLIQMAK